MLKSCILAHVVKLRLPASGKVVRGIEFHCASERRRCPARPPRSQPVGRLRNVAGEKVLMLDAVRQAL